MNSYTKLIIIIPCLWDRHRYSLLLIIILFYLTTSIGGSSWDRHRYFFSLFLKSICGIRQFALNLSWNYSSNSWIILDLCLIALYLISNILKMMKILYFHFLRIQDVSSTHSSTVTSLCVITMYLILASTVNNIEIVVLVTLLYG